MNYHLNSINRKQSKVLYQDIVGYGVSNFLCKVLVILNSEEEMFKVEKIFIDYYYSYKKNSLNIAKGGVGGDTLSRNPKTKEIMEKRELTHPRLPTYGMLNKKHSQSYKKIMSDSRKGENNPFYGKIPSEEHRNKISIKNSGELNSQAKEYIAITPSSNIIRFKCASKWLNENNMSIVVFRKFLNKGKIPLSPKSCTKGIIARKNMEFWEFYNIEKWDAKLPEYVTGSNNIMMVTPK